MILKRLTALTLTALLSVSLLAGCGSSSEESSTSSSAEDSQEAVSTDSESTSEETDSEESEEASSESTADESTEDEIKLSVKITGTDGLMSFTFPEGWSDLNGELDESLDGAYTVEAGALEEAVFFLAASESKGDGDLTGLEEYNDELVSVLTGNEALTNISDQVKDSITLEKSGLTAWKNRFTADYNDQNITYWVITTEDDGRYYQMCCWTATSNATAEEKKFLAAADTFTVNG